MASMMSALPVTAPIGQTTAKSLGRGDEIRNEPEVLTREHLAGPGNAGLHFVRDKDDPVLLAVLGEPRQESASGIITPPSPCTGSTSRHAIRFPPICLSIEAIARSAHASPHRSGGCPQLQR